MSVRLNRKRLLAFIITLTAISVAIAWTAVHFEESLLWLLLSAPIGYGLGYVWPIKASKQHSARGLGCILGVAMAIIPLPFFMPQDMGQAEWVIVWVAVSIATLGYLAVVFGVLRSATWPWEGESQVE